MALVPWGGSSATQYSTPSSPFEPNGIIYANDVNAAIRLPSLVTSAIWNTLGVTDVTYNNSLEDARSALSATVLACGMEYNSTFGLWVFPNMILFGEGVAFNKEVEFSSTILVGGNSTLSGTLKVAQATTLSSTLYVDGTTTLSSTLTVDGATTLNASLTVNGGAILTRSTSAQEALRINVGKSIFEDQTMDNIRYSSSYTASHAFLLEEYHGGSLTPTYETVISAESISTGYLNFIAQSIQTTHTIDAFDQDHFVITLRENLEKNYLYCFTLSYTNNNVTYRNQAFYLKVFDDISGYETIGAGIGFFRVVDSNHLHYYTTAASNPGNPNFKFVKICKIDN